MRARRLVLLLAVALVSTSCASSGGVKPVADARKVPTFTEPVRLHAPDPWITRTNGLYYLTYTTGGSVVLVHSRSLAGLHDAPAVTIWNKGNNVWAPELHRLSGRWYVYYSSGDTVATMRVHVLEGGTGPDPLATPYRDRGIVSPSGQWAIDATVLQIPHKPPYLVWSGHSGNAQVLQLARLSTPWKLTGSVATISRPTHAWETHGLPVNEGPEPLLHNGRVFLTFSASGCWTDNYSLGLLSLTPGHDPLKPASWRKTPYPVFQSGHGAYATGHNGFFTSPDGSQSWLVYHAVSYKGGNPCTQDRSTRAQPFTWTHNGTPNFGTPARTATPLPAPSGDPNPNAVVRLPPP